MKIRISYPPIESDKGVPLLGQNRQFQWFSEPTYIYPMVPAYAATVLKQAGYEVRWDDAIAEGKRYKDWLGEIRKQRPDLLVIETKTPVVKKHWRIIDDLKAACPETKVVLMGDHVTALPEESFEQCKVDFVLTGGDYDFLLLNLARYLEGNEPLEPGIWYRADGAIKNTGPFVLKHDLNTLPFIDRELTRWDLYNRLNGNYKTFPGTYTMVGRDCWWHRCTFCSWTTLFPAYRTGTPERLVEEIGMLIEQVGVKEVFDDTGTFPAGAWIRKFSKLMIEAGYHKRVRLGCNMRFGALNLEEYRLMRRAGFRMLLFGLESAHQETLERIRKNNTVARIIDSCKKAKQAGLEPHLTIMFGYPWETKEQAEKTLELGKYLLKKGYADTMQATLMVPYPGTPLFEECKEKGLLRTLDWDRYDMREPVMETPLGDEEISEMTQGMYKVAFDPEFVVRKILRLRSKEDVKFLFRAAKKVAGHLRDFGLHSK
ncbi:MAG: radical SAM protein [Candidatus Latescibacteria bacterium]|nr:radical SAM protein [Candidatus Latescibacterota bacterium]